MNFKKLTLNVPIFLTLFLFAGTAAAGAATLNVPASYPTIQAAINAASPGDTVLIAAGTYVETLTINKQIQLQGAGPLNTIITPVNPGTSVVTVTAGGTDASHRLIIKDLAIRNASGGDNSSGSGIYYANGPLGYTTFDNISVDHNSGNGISIESQNPLVDIIIQNSSLVHNGNAGLRAAAECPSITGLKILNSHLDFNSAGLTVYSQAIANWEISNSTFNDNSGPADQSFTGGYGAGFDGIATLNTLSISCSQFSRNRGNSGDPSNDISSGLYVLSVDQSGASYTNITVSTTVFDQNARDGIVLQPGDGTILKDIIINCNTIENSGEAGVLISFFGSPQNISLFHNNFSGNLFDLLNLNASLIDASANWWNSPNGPSADELNGNDGPITISSFLSAASLCPSSCSPSPAISILKTTNGSNNNSAPGLYVPAGSAVNWAYLVKNTGNVALSNVVVTDDQGVTVTCPQNTLADGDSMICTAGGTAQAGQYTNTGTAKGTAPSGQIVNASDPDNYFGSAPAISIVKKTNGTNNDMAPGLSITAGSAVTWTYIVTNTGNVTLTNLSVTDNKVAGVSCPATSLIAGASMTCSASGTAILGQYTNIGKVYGTPPVGSQVTASNPDNYYGVPPCTGKIGDFVWNDLNANGIQNTGEPGIGSVVLQLQNSGGTVIQTTSSTSTGYYQFTGVCAGTYSVIAVTPSGYSPVSSLVGTNRAIDSNGSPAVVTLATSTSVDQTIDFGFVKYATGYTTYTMGGWGSEPSGSNPGWLLATYFTKVYSAGSVTIGGTKYLKFTKAKAIEIFLPNGATPGVLTASATNPTTSSAGVFASQTLALRLSVDFSAAGIKKTGLGNLKVVSGPLAGATVNQVLTLANSVLGGNTGALPTGLSLSGLNDILNAINNNFDNGTTNNGYLY
jgi:uncharacterized repeat protein (TIGR01451 family)